MNSNRRDFLKQSLSVGTAAVFFPSVGFEKESAMELKDVKFRFCPYTLELKHVFTVASSSRRTTPIMIVEIEKDGLIGYGEASMPPYLGESFETATAFLSQVNIAKYQDIYTLEDILLDIDGIAPGNHAAKAAVDIALHDWIGKRFGYPWYRIWGLDPEKTPVTSFTIGIDTPEVVRQKVHEAEVYKVLKVKLGRETDREMIETIRGVTDKPIRVDVNQGWTDKSVALSMIEWLSQKNVEFVEQPMPKEMIEELVWLRERSPIPIIGDESVSRLVDVRSAYGVYDGINVKLMKCSGMREAYKMITLGKVLGMKIMLGCMVESSCAISAATQLSPLVDWADLDGAVLNRNDPFEGATIENGKMKMPDAPGIGAIKL